MSSTFLKTIGGAALGAAMTIGFAGSASAVLIDFEDLTGSSTYVASCGAISCPQTVVEATSAGNVTITGGVVLTKTVALPADQTSIYGAASPILVGNLGLTNPIHIAFDAPVTNFLVDVLNGLPADIEYTVADNAGHSSTFIVAPNTSSGVQTIGFAATGTEVTITAANNATYGYDFFIDNIQFNVPIVCNLRTCEISNVPEPGTMAILGLGAGLLGLGAARRRRR